MLSQDESVNATYYPSLNGRHALVTGGASGIGEALVRALALQGCAVSFFDIDSDSGEALAQDLNSLGFKAHFDQVDLTDIALLKKLRILKNKDKKLLKILGTGELKSKNIIECSKVTKSAEEKLQKLGVELKISKAI